MLKEQQTVLRGLNLQLLANQNCGKLLGGFKKIPIKQ